MGELLKDLETTWAKNAKEPFTPFIREGLDHLRKACAIMDEVVEKYGETEEGVLIDKAGEKRVRDAVFEAEMAQLFAGAEESNEAKYILRIARDVMKIRRGAKN